MTTGASCPFQGGQAPGLPVHGRDHSMLGLGRDGGGDPCESRLTAPRMPSSPRAKRLRPLQKLRMLSDHAKSLEFAHGHSCCCSLPQISQKSCSFACIHVMETVIDVPAAISCSSY